MGYWQEDGRWADTMDVSLMDGVATEGGSGSIVEVGDRGTLRLALRVSGAGLQNEIQTMVLSGLEGEEGSIRLSFDQGSTYSDQIPLGLEAIPAIQSVLDEYFGPGNAIITPSMETEGAVCFEFLDGQSHPLVQADLSGVVPEPARNELQELNINASGGTCTLTFGGETTEPIAYDANSETVQAALESLDSIGEGNIDVSDVQSGRFHVEFTGALGGQPLDLIVGDDGELDGDVSVVRVRSGQPEGVPHADVSKTQEAGPGGDFEGELDVEVETSHDGEDFRSLGSFTQATTAGEERKSFTGTDRLVRVSWTLDGASEVTFSVTGEAV